jgi:hypothetical protein
MGETESKGPEHSGEKFPLPPPTFEYLAWSLRVQAEMHLGLLHLGEEKDRPEPDLDAARHSIDMMAMLKDKTKGNLSVEEQRFLENSLTELRFRYVEVAGQTSKPEAGQQETSKEDKKE